MTKKNINLNFDIFIKKVMSYIIKDDDIELITKAYNYASEKHFGVKRMTGEDYIEHPLNVAYILTDIEADANTLVAGLLHDILEDTDTTKEELSQLFNNEVAFLVDGVTKINKLNFESGNAAEIATERKILVGLCEDVRVIFIKLADRLHNMRTLWVHTEKKQKEKAKETLDILTPIAHRLGMNSIKSELEDLSLRYYKPEIYFDIVERLNQTKKERDEVVEQMKKNVSEILDENKIKHEIKGRAKSIYSIYKKLDKGKRFNDIYDLLALRIFVNTEQECYQALGVIHSKYRPLPYRFKDYIAMPKTNMYQSLHTTVFGIDGNLFEIQIRTYEMDEVAERGIASHWSYKEHGSKVAVRNSMDEKLQFFRSIMELNNDGLNDEEFINSVKEDIFKNTIYVFTPNGDVIELPNGATPIDFAYRVHSEVGERMIGAIVNGVIVPLDYKLSDNDVVKINTSKNSSGPSKEWINIAKTTGAKNKIKAFFNKIDKEENCKKGEELLLRELRKKKIIFNDFLTDKNIDRILAAFKYNTIQELYVNIGNNHITASSVINIINGEPEQLEKNLLKKIKNNTDFSKIKDDIIVEGIDQIKVNIASCCKPIPGDNIIGFITKGYGISVHRSNCPNVRELSNRTVSVYWNDETNKKYKVNLLVKSISNSNMLLDIVQKAAHNGISIQTINTYKHHENATYDLIALVNNKDHLKKFIDDVDTLKDVVEIERVIQ